MAAINSRVIIGETDNPILTFENKNIISISANLAVALAGEELSIDIAEPVVIQNPNEDTLLVPSGSDGFLTSDSKDFAPATINPEMIEYGTPVWIYTDNSISGRFYFRKAERIATTQYRIYCESIVGLLDKQDSIGGIYRGEKFSEVCDEILNPCFATTLKLTSSVKNGILEVGSPYLFDYNEIFFIDQPGTVAEITFKLGNNYRGQSSSFPGESWLFHSNLFCLKINAQYGQTISKVGWYSGTTLVHSFANVSDYTQTFTATLNCTNRTITFNGETYSFNANTGMPVTISYSPGDTNGIALYSSKVYKYGNLVSDWVPCYSGNKVGDYYGMYDIIGKRFLGTRIRNSSYQHLETGTDTGEKVRWRVGNILEQLNAPVEYSTEIADIPIYGWIPYASKRANLYQLMFATGVNMIKSTNGGVLFTALKSENAITVPDADIYEGGSVSATSDSYNVSVTEHSFTSVSSTTTETLYDNSVGELSGLQFIKFSSAPIDVSSISFPSGTGWKYVNANCGLFEGTGIITGKPLADTQFLIEKKTDKATYSTSDVTVTDATLISPLNGSNVLQRLWNYYVGTKTISQPIILRGERCGKLYSMKNPFKENVTAFLSKISLNISSIVKADCEFLQGFNPVQTGNKYRNYVLLTGSGTWTVPNGVTEIKAVLVGGGTGGNSGLAGTSGTDYVSGRTDWNGGKGGTAGTGGIGGRVVYATITSPAASYSYSCGVGGAGGAASSSSQTPNIGLSGTATTFGSYSSATGSSTSGVTNLMTGDVYGSSGTSGVDGADASEITYTSSTNMFNWQNQNGGYVGNSYGGTGYATSSYFALPSKANVIACARGGFGGGASYGANGGDATAAYQQGTRLYGGNGGNGANGVARTQSTYGNGGNGGHGGGGGGAGGISWSNQQPSYYGYPGASGTGGMGGAGGQGGDGCIIIYY